MKWEGNPRAGIDRSSQREFLVRNDLKRCGGHVRHRTSRAKQCRYRTVRKGSTRVVHQAGDPTRLSVAGFEISELTEESTSSRKQELDRLGLFKEYEDWFLDLFKKPG